MTKTEPMNCFAQLVLAAMPDTSVAQRFLRKCPTPIAVKRLSRLEREEILDWTPQMQPFFAALDLGQLVGKSHEEIIGHAYSSMELGREMVERFSGEDQESLCVACTDVHNEIIAWKTLFIGGNSECMAYPDKIFQYALQCSAHGIVLIHNHPTGDVQPSDQDSTFTWRLDRGCALIGLHLLDFLIVGRDEYYSWREEQASR